MTGREGGGWGGGDSGRVHSSVGFLSHFLIIEETPAFSIKN
jgi:hypothetical protein